MNNPHQTPPALLQRIIDAGPLKCFAGFYQKAKRLALTRGDHAAVMEIEVAGHFLAAENHVRHQAATDSAGIAQHVGEIITTAQRIAADNIITPEEERELHAELTTLCARSRRHASALTARKLLPL